MRKFILAAGSLVGATLLLSFTPPEPEAFLEKPYLQLGDAPKLSAPENLMLLWHTGKASADLRIADARTFPPAAARRAA